MRLNFSWLLCLVFFTFLALPSLAFAQEYVLPYPGFMPGHPLYKASELVDRLQQWWSFGSFAKFSYHLSMSDKKLVEAKTLFEYRQYLLAFAAIENYEFHLRGANKFLGEAQGEGKNVFAKRLILKNAIAVHREVFEKLKSEYPREVFWNPEKGEPRTIEIENILNRAIELGKECEKQ